LISKGFAGLPPIARGQRIGLFGGSFNPPHDGHRAASLIALHRLRLDWVWWLVSPGNPLKDTRDLPPVGERLEAARTLASHPRIVVTGFEQTLGSPFTCDTVASLARRCSGVHFVWLMGADSFATFHHWKNWRQIADTLPLGIIDRPGSTLHAAQARAASTLRAMRLNETDAARLPNAVPPAYVFLHGPRSPLSSTQLRAAGKA
jgi:nicotinate-nucleotide adenylyltransferase